MIFIKTITITADLLFIAIAFAGMLAEKDKKMKSGVSLILLLTILNIFMICN